MDAFLISFGIIFVAELGDKSQLMAMTFAARYRAITILLGITVATALVHLFSVAARGRGRRRLPTEAISVVAGIAFLGFAAWTVRGDELDEDEAAEGRAVVHGRCSLTVGVAFFLAELGDKTMLATDHAGDRQRADRYLDRVHARDGRRRRAGDRRGSAARHPTARTGDQDRRFDHVCGVRCRADRGRVALIEHFEEAGAVCRFDSGRTWRVLDESATATR